MPSKIYDYLRIRRKSKRRSPSGSLRAATPEPGRPEPTSSSQTIVPTSANNNAFAIALQRYLNDLDPEEQQLFRAAHRTIEPQHLLARVASLDDNDRDSTSRKFFDRVEKFLTVLNTLLTSVALGIQGSPEIASLVVGGARLILDLALNIAEFFKKLTSMISRLNSHLEHLQEISKHSDLPLIQSSAANVYGSILQFYHHAYHVFKTKDDRNHTLLHLRTFARVQWEPFELKFGEINNDIINNLNVLGHSSQASTLTVVRKLDDERRRESESHSKRLNIEERKRFLNWLSPSDFDSIQQHILGKRWHGTGLWLLEHRDFTTWFSNPSSRSLWCNGPPGVGKSVLSSIVIDHIQSERASDRNDVGLAFAYFRHDQSDSSNAENSIATHVIATLLKQLARRVEEFPKELVDAFNSQYKNDRNPTFDFCVRSFHLLASRFTESFVVIDALDECNEISRGLMLDFLYGITKIMPSIKLFITSRLESTIAESILALKVPTIEIHARHVTRDIAEYVNGRLNLLTEPWPERVKPRSRFLRLQDPSTKDRIFDALVGNSNGVFLWVDLQLDNICRQKNDEDILEVLLSLPAELNETYTRIFKQIRKEARPLQQLARKCLMWVLHARQPISLYELRDAISTTENCISRSDLEKNRRKYTTFDIMDACRHLLVSESPYFDENYHGMATIRLLHYSVAEYLYMDNGAIADDAIFSMLRDPILVERELATTCVIFLQLVYLGDGPAATFQDMLDRSTGERDQFSWYCAWHFDEHLAGAKLVDSRLRAHIDKLLAMVSTALAALAQLRHMSKKYTTPEFERFDWLITPRTLILTSRLSEFSQILDDPRWCQGDIDPVAIHEACANGSLDQVRRLLLLNLSPNETNRSGQTPFSIAILREDVPIVELLLQFQADVDQSVPDYIFTALEISSSHGSLSLVDLLLQYGAKGVEGDSTFSEALFRAIYNYHSEAAEFLLHRGAIPTERCLLHAAEYDMDSVVEAILEAGVDPNCAELNGEGRRTAMRPLYSAAFGRRTQVVRLLLKYGALTEIKGGHYGTALQAAACGGDLEIVKILIEHGAAIDKSDGEYGTALAASALGRDKEMARVLLDVGADVNILGGTYGSALGASVVDHNLFRRPRGYSDVTVKVPFDDGDITAMILDAGANISVQGPEALGQAIGHGNVRAVEALLKKGCQLACIPQVLDRAPLSLASSADLVKLLIQHGADPNDSQHDNPSLRRAAIGGYEDVVKFLVEAGADIDFLGTLHAACYGANSNIVKLLLEGGADSNQICKVFLAWNPYICSPLHVTCALELSAEQYEGVPQTQKTEIVHVLLEHGAKVNATDGNGCTALLLACATCKGDFTATETVQLLVEYGADVNALETSGIGPLRAACAQGHADIAKLLLASGVRDGVQRKVALQEAAHRGYADVVECFLKDGMDLRGLPGAIDSALHYASFGGHAPVVAMLLDAGASVDSIGHYGTAFEAALTGHAQSRYCEGGWGQVIKLFRTKGAKEPRGECHFGILCDGPSCSSSRKNPSNRPQIPYEGRPKDWIVGMRYSCNECKKFNYCATCNTKATTVPAIVDSGTCGQDTETLAIVPNDNEGYDSTHQKSPNHELDHEITAFEQREYFGEEETLGEMPFPNYWADQDCGKGPSLPDWKSKYSVRFSAPNFDWQKPSGCKIMDNITSDLEDW